MQSPRWLALPFVLRLLPGPAVSAPAPDAASQFYEPESVQTIHLEINHEDLDRLQRALPKRIYVPATFRWNDQTLQNVGVRYKGDSSSSPDSHHKRSFLIDFSEFEKGQRFLGLRHVALDNGVQFGSLFSERLITDVLRGVGVKASRCNYARVDLNGKAIGVYVNVERIDKAFLQHYFGTEQGALFKVEGGPGADFRYVGADPASYHHFELHSGDKVEAFPILLEFIRAASDPAGSEADLRRNLDVDAFAKTTAVLLLAGAFDQYTGWNPHNYYLYLNPADQRWTYIPWDLDVGFADRAFGKVPVLEGWNAAWPAPVPNRPLLELLISQPNLLRQYREQANTILETWFRPEILIPKLHALYDQIRDDLAKDPYPPRRITVPSDTGYPDILASMEAFIRQRYAIARAQLDAPGDRPRPMQMRQPADQDPKPGPPSPDASTDLRAVKVTSSSVELKWANHVEGAVAFIVQRCDGFEATDFTNSIGQGGRDITTAIDRDVKPGISYRYRVYAVRPTPHGPQGTGVSNEITVPIPKN
jgi:spore coat protein CotH